MSLYIKWYKYTGKIKFSILFIYIFVAFTLKNYMKRVFNNIL